MCNIFEKMIAFELLIRLPENYQYNFTLMHNGPFPLPFVSACHMAGSKISGTGEEI